MANETMERTTIALPRDLHRRLRVMAAERGISMTQLIREMIDEGLEDKFRESRRPKPTSIGIFDSGRSDISELTSNGLPEAPTWR